MDNWHQYTEGNKSVKGNKFVKEYVEKVDEFLIRCSTFHKEGEVQILSRCKAGLRNDLRIELLARGVNELETAYALVQDVDFARTSYTSKSHNYMISVFRPPSSSLLNRFRPKPLHIGTIFKGKSLERDNRNKDLESSKVSFTIKCYKCQGYRHLAASCRSLVTPIEATKSDSDVYIFKGEDSEIDEEPTSDAGLNCINQTPSTHLFVVKCVSSTPAEKYDWRKSVIFHTFTKIRDKSCKVIVDIGSCINAIPSKSLKYLGLEVVPHPTRSKCLGLTPQHLRPNNDVVSQSISIITKTIYGVTR